MSGWRERNEADRRSADPAVRFAALLEEVAVVAHVDAENVGGDPYAWPPRAPLTDDERAEYERLRVLSRRLDYHASEVRAGIRAYPLIPVLERAVEESGGEVVGTKCGCCGRTYDEDEFLGLEYVGTMTDADDEGRDLEIRECSCGSSLSLLVSRRSTQLACVTRGDGR